MMMASSNFLVPNDTFIVELVAFLLVLGALARYVLPVVNKTLEERQERIRQAMADAEEAKRVRAEARHEYDRIVGEARSQARGVVDEANKLAEQLRAEKRQQAEAEYNQKISQAAADIEAQARRAAEELRRQAADLVVAVTEKVIGEGIDLEGQRSLIDRAISEVAAQAGSAEVTA